MMMIPKRISCGCIRIALVVSVVFAGGHAAGQAATRQVDVLTAGCDAGAFKDCSDLGHAYESQGNLEKAKEVYERLLRLQEVALVHNDSDIAATLVDLGNVAYRRGELDVAYMYYSRALAIDTKAVPDGADVALVLANLGSVSRDRGDLTAASAFLLRALAIQQRLAPDSLPIAMTLANLGRLALSRGDLNAAHGFLVGALQIRARLAPASSELASTLSSMAAEAQQRGDYKGAIALLLRASHIEESIDPAGERLGGIVASLAFLNKESGNYVAAKALAARSIAILGRITLSSISAITALQIEGDIELEQGHLDAADRIFRRVLSTLQRDVHSPNAIADTLLRFGNVALRRHDLDTAEEFFTKALKLDESTAAEFNQSADPLNNLGLIALDRRDFSRAGEYFQRALNLLEKRNPEDPSLAVPLSGLATVSAEQGDFTSAETLLRRSLSLEEKKGRDTLGVAGQLFNLGSISQHQGQLVAAETHFKRSLRIVEKLAPDSWQLAQILYRLATVARQKHDFRTAARFLRESVDALESQLKHLGGTSDQQSVFTAAYADIYKDYVDTLVELRKTDEAYHILERSRARSLLEMFAERDADLAQDIPDDLRAARQTLEEDFVKTQAALAKSSVDSDTRGLQSRLRRLEAKRGEIADAIRKASPRYAALRYPKALSVDEVRKNLDPGTLFLAFSVGRERTLLFVVQPEQLIDRSFPGVAAYPVPIDALSLRRSIQAYRALLEFPSGDQGDIARVRSVGQALQGLLMLPAEVLIRKSDRLLISPDGPLHLLAFNGLMMWSRASGPTTTYLVEDKPIHTVISGTVYAELRRSRRSPANIRTLELVAFGDPVYQEYERSDDAELRSSIRRGYKFQPLPGTREEVLTIAQLWPGQSVSYLGGDATAERAEAIGRGVRYIHFACHAFVDEQFPLNSALALAISPTRTDGHANGFLQAWKILERMRIDADLVTLSACETGLGREVGGEGLLGLARAFQYAGARSVLASLWPVSDEATTKLMAAFYRSLKSGCSKDEALRAAQIELLRDPSGRFREPFFWAGFELVGDWK